MTLRTRILTLFAVLGVLPILALGAFNYVRSMSAVEALLEVQTAAIARRVSTGLRERYAFRAGELLLLAENAETQRLYRAHASGSPTALEDARAAAATYLSSAWALFRTSYHWIELRDSTGAPLHTMGAAPGGVTGARVGVGPPSASGVELTFPVRELASGRVRGRVVAAVRAGAVLGDDLRGDVFGRAGYTVLLDREGGTILHHPSRRFLNQPMAELLGPDGWGLDAETFRADSGGFRHSGGDSLRVATFIALEAPPWTVVASASVDEFAAPFLRTRTVNLLVMLLVAALMGTVFLLVTRRLTASLEQLTVAADDVARGELSPRLPKAGGDEVGRLSRAFALMIEEVRQMLQRVEETRDMAVMGEFASQISHEIRNPLTSIKLNLQRLGRDVDDHRIPEDSAPPVRISLREVDRLERSVQRVLDMARTHPPVPRRCSIHRVLDHAVEAVSSQLETQGVSAARAYGAATDDVLADPEDLEGVFVNLLLNAAEAMPRGGEVLLATECAGEAGRLVRIRVSDEGPGVPPEIREQIFRPFVSTKTASTGFGLAIARRAVEAHGGRIDLDREREGSGGRGGGATFVVDLPLALSSDTRGTVADTAEEGEP